jgi:hypothetical protein
MEDFERRWAAVEQMMQTRFDKVPDMEGMLFLIGVNELGRIPDSKKYTKEQKQDLMHVAVCTLLAPLGYFVPEGIDEEGWPHFRNVKPVEAPGLQGQEQLLKECIVRYFDL